MSSPKTAASNSLTRRWSRPAMQLALAAALVSATVALATNATESNSPTPQATQLATQPVPVAGRSAIVGGVKLFYREAGDTQSPTIVLLHGTPSSSFMFRNLIPLLATRYHVIAPDYPGYGHSEQPDPSKYSYTFDNLARSVDGLLEQLKVERYALLIQDYGGPVGMRIATAHPERVTALVIQNANLYAEGLLRPAWDPIIASWSGRTAETDAAVGGFFSPAGINFQYTHGMRNAAAVPPDAIVFDQKIAANPGHREVELLLAANYHTNPASYPAWQEYLRKQQPPVLVVWGKNDPFFGTVTPERIRGDVPQAEVHLFDTGHFALEEDVVPIAEKTLEFLNRKVK